MDDDARTRAIQEEQAHVDRAYTRLAALRARAEQRRREALAAEVVTHADLVDRDAMAWGAASRVAALTIGDEEPLVFGRIDRSDGEILHIGRVSVLSEDYDPLVVDWRSDAAAPFYRATPADPQGLVRRRVLQCRGRRVLLVEDQLLDLEVADVAGGEPLVGDAALMAALTRDRSAHMRDIVATIQREQDEIIRRPATGVLVVSGGPGTGKTAVALHRVAYLLYRHRERLERRGVLVVGPSRRFVEYIRAVLPALGETTAVLRPLGHVVPGLATDRHDPTAVGRLKGDARMAAVIARIARRLRPGLAPRTALTRLRTIGDDLAAAAAGILTQREIDLLVAAWADDRDAGRPPSVEDVALVDELRFQLGDLDRPPPTPARSDEMPAEVTTYADRLARPDAAAIIGDEDYTEFGHVVVDEAQDCSPMQWRMLARRGGLATWTVVGDLAQQVSGGGPNRWDQVTALIGRERAEVAELSVNYRTPAPIMSLAGRLLPHIAPGQQPPRSARDGVAPVITTGVSDVSAAAVAAACRERTATSGTVGVVASGERSAELMTRLAGQDVQVLDPWDAKGLEFDAIVVVAPEEIADAYGWSSVYVALTRATQQLTVVTALDDLPAPLQPSADPQASAL